MSTSRKLNTLLFELQTAPSPLPVADFHCSTARRCASTLGTLSPVYSIMRTPFLMSRMANRPRW